MAWINVALKITVSGSECKTELRFIVLSPFYVETEACQSFLASSMLINLFQSQRYSKCLLRDITTIQLSVLFC